MRCTNCKEKFDKKYFNQKYCDKLECKKAHKDFALNHFKEVLKKQDLKRAREQKKFVENKIGEKKVLECRKESLFTSLKNEIQKLSKIIDFKNGYNTCICCDRELNIIGGKYEGVNACHYHSVGSNKTLSLNLDNIHTGLIFCNKHSREHIKGYAEGLANRYGRDYAEYVIIELPIKYSFIGIKSHELRDLLPIVRENIRNADTISIDWKRGREYFNNLFGIYT